jgi:indole-3-glycerol phosphate synthase
MNSLLSNIIRHTKVKLSRQITNTPEDELLRTIDNKKKYTPVNVYNCLEIGNTNIMGEYKRVNTDIDADIEICHNRINCDDQIVKYLVGGVCGISVMTETSRFQGCISDLVQARNILEMWNRHHKRVFLLRNDYIFSKYQILESVLYNVDSILLFVHASSYIMCIYGIGNMYVICIRYDVCDM